MAGSAPKYRHLSRKSSHRQALLRNLVTSLFKHESITTTWPKAKEAQRLAEKLITLGKKNTEAARKKALQTFYVCVAFFPLLEDFFIVCKLRNVSWESQTPSRLNEYTISIGEFPLSSY